MPWDTIVIGSGYGGAMVADRLVRAGERVLMVERGPWIRRGAHNWGPDGSLELQEWFQRDKAYRVAYGSAGVRGYEDWAHTGSVHCVGGPSVFAGTVALRFRAEDFDPPEEIVGASGAAWPLDYEELEPWYAQAERLLGVAGACGEDPTEPPRSGPYPGAASELSPPARRIAGAAAQMGMHPLRLPLAIDQRACARCAKCDTFACAVEAKNDLAVAVLGPLVPRGLALVSELNAEALLVEGDRVAGVRCRRADGTATTLRAGRVVLSAGALGSAHLLLASGLAERNPAGWAVGRFLTRHCNAIVMGVFPRRLAGVERFHKQVGVHDLYFGDGAVPGGRLGALQQTAAPPWRLVHPGMPPLIRPFTRRLVGHMTGLLAMAEDQPRAENRVALDPGDRDQRGMPRLVIHHRHSARDEAARAALVKQARSILWRAGARYRYVHRVDTFSHATGTVRMGDDPRTAPLDAGCAFRGVEGLYVVDGSSLPTAAGVNPSLTIAANALRVGARLAGSGLPDRDVSAVA